MAFYLARTATYSHKNSYVHYTRRALSNHINFVSIREILPHAVAKYTCLQKPLKWLTFGKRLRILISASNYAARPSPWSCTAFQTNQGTPWCMSSCPQRATWDYMTGTPCRLLSTITNSSCCGRLRGSCFSLYAPRNVLMVGYSFTHTHWTETWEMWDP